MSPRIAKVIVDLSLDRVFDYLIPAELAGKVGPGSRVRVPFGKSHRNGYILRVESKSDYPLEKLKSISGDSLGRPCVGPSLVKLAEWMAEYYCCSREAAAMALLPAPVRGGKIGKKKIYLYYLARGDEETQEFVFKKGRRSPAKAAILNALLSRHGVTKADLLKAAGVGESALKSLVDGGWVEKVEGTEARDPFAGVEVSRTMPATPTEEQARALEVADEMLSVSNGSPGVLLLRGVTGSGKTEVYLQAIAKVLEAGKESIALVPEISLTPQTTERFRARFGDMVSVLHSRLSAGERYDEWMRIHDGEVKIVVGARSALFAPFRNLGLIVVDEEHENSYKQEEAPRYNARDVAVVRGKMENALVILGSATPSVESYHNALTGKYRLAELTKRVDDLVMPETRVVDMRDEALETGGAKMFSRELVATLKERLASGEQSIIFLNRRGFASQMLCRSCGYVASCANCAITYTYHKGRGSLTCHLCGASLPAPSVCPECGAEDIRYGGLGTEKVELALAKLFPKATVRRMDSDTMTRRHSHEETLNEFRSGRIDILVGTQMIAKGLHFPNVTLVGIVYADLGLHIPDFRSQERTFQLLTQVSGRAGRGDRPGVVVIQTYTPFNPAIQRAVEHDYKGFFEEEMEVRQVLRYPPMSRMIAVRFLGEDEMATLKAAEKFMEMVRPAVPSSVEVAGPSPCPIARIKAKYRFISIFRGTGMRDLRAALRSAALSSRRPKGVFVVIDADPVNMM